MNEAARSKRRAALASIAASASMAAAKLVAGLLSGSLALLSDAGHAGLDTTATLLTYFAVRVADKPADEEHHYGHAKVEAVAALAETGFLLALSVVVLIEAVRRLWSGVGLTLHADWLAFSVLAVSILVDFVRWRSLGRIALRTHSHALAADALHFASDFVSSILVLIGLVVTRFGFLQGDALAALGVAAFIALAGGRLGQRTVDALLDAAPKGVAQKVRRLVESTPGVVGVDSLRLRPSGARIIGELEIAVPRTTTIEKAEDLRNEITRAISAAMPETVLTITATPRALDSETLRERILLIAARRRVSIHHVTVQDVDGHKAVSLDIELDRRMTHGAAHDVASGLELAILAELGDDIEVETHIEPLDVEEQVGVDAGSQTCEAIRIALDRHAGEGGVVGHVHGVRTRRTQAGLVVNYHCRVQPSLSVELVHEAVDNLDRAVRSDFPEIVRIVGHAEPLAGRSGQSPP